MSTTPTDYDALARRYLDLWQQEMAKLAQDPKAAGTWANLFQGMMQNAGAAWSAPLSAAGAAAMKTDANHATAPSQTWPTPAAASSGDGGVALADVLRRIDARLDGIERRLTALEQRALEAAQAPKRRTKSAKP